MAEAEDRMPPFMLLQANSKDKYIMKKLFRHTQIWKELRNRNDIGVSLKGGYYVHDKELLEAIATVEARRIMKYAKLRENEETINKRYNNYLNLLRPNRGVASTAGDEQEESSRRDGPYEVQSMPHIPIRPNIPALKSSNCSGPAILTGIFGANLEAKIVKELKAGFGPTFMKFLAAHNRTKYIHILQSILEKEEQGKTDEGMEQKGTCTSQNEQSAKNSAKWHRKKLHKFLWTLISIIVPYKLLFGPNANVKKIKKAVFSYASLNPYERINFAGLNITMTLEKDGICWLKHIVDERQKCDLLTKFINWFFVEYVNVVLRTYFYRVWFADCGGKSIWVRKQDFLKRRNESLEKLESKGTLELLETELHKDQNPMTALTFSFRPDSARPIYKLMPHPSLEKTMRIWQQILTQAWSVRSRDFVVNDLHKVWAELAKTKTELKQPLYYVTCDIEDAFGSIRQDKLLEILDDLLQNMPEALTLKTFDSWKVRYARRIDVPGIRQFIHLYDESVPLLFPRNSISAPPADSVDDIELKLEDFKRDLMEWITHVTVTIKKNTYLLRQGVPQGLRICSILANIYYGTMELEELSEFRKHGMIIRYVDDFAYITNDLQAAMRFQAFVKKGILEYNCHFKPSKIQTNLESQRDTFHFLGYQFNISTMEMKPDESRLTKSNLNLSRVVPELQKTTFLDRAFGDSEDFLKKGGLNTSFKKARRQLTRTTRLAAKRVRLLTIHMLHFYKPEWIMIEINHFIKRITERAIRSRLKSFQVQKLRLKMWRIFRSSLQNDKRLPELKRRIDDKIQELKSRRWATSMMLKREQALK